MASSRDRQRKLARAKLDRQMARRAVRERRRRRILAGVGAGRRRAAHRRRRRLDRRRVRLGRPADRRGRQDVCAWTPQSATTNTNLKDVGTPPTKDIPTSGTEPMTITTDQGAPIVVEPGPRERAVRRRRASRYLAEQEVLRQHRRATRSPPRARCAAATRAAPVSAARPTASTTRTPPAAPEPSASAGPAPATAAPLYPKGTVALIGNPPGTNGSQFLIFFKDSRPADAGVLDRRAR